jgi:hypothetical protein
MPPIEENKNIVTGSTIIAGCDTAINGTDTTSYTICDGTTSNAYLDFSSSSASFSFDLFQYINSIKLSRDVELKKDKNSILILSKSNLAVCWDEELEKFGEHELISFEHNLKEDEKCTSKNNSHQDTENRLDNLISILLKSDGNYVLDLESNLFYKFSPSANSWIKVSGDIKKLNFSRRKKVSQIKKEKNERIFICEKISKKLNFWKGVTHLDQGYIYAPYVPMQTIEIVNDANTFNQNNRIYSRYATTTLNNDNYGTITINDNYGQLDHP